MFFFFLVGITLGILLKVVFPTETDSSYIQKRAGGYEYINPLVDFESVESTKIGKLANMEKTLQKYVDNTIEDYDVTKVSHISIYYKDLNSGAWIGVNEDEDFSPASLLKLPIMIASYKIAESDSTFLQQEIVYEEKYIASDQNITPTLQLEDGKTYTIEQLIERLIKYSDNKAVEPILSEIPNEQLADIYTDLGIEVPEQNDITYELKVKDYASFFRILYNASYLNKDMSTKALKLLSEAEFDEGIVAGLPDGVKIASKFGERIFESDSIEIRKQLHECGIVYHPNKPYILCIMTKGSDLVSQEKILQEISSMIYLEVNND